MLFTSGAPFNKMQAIHFSVIPKYKLVMLAFLTALFDGINEAKMLQYQVEASSLSSPPYKHKKSFILTYSSSPFHSFLVIL